jgi:hypothetical protein
MAAAGIAQVAGRYSLGTLNFTLKLTVSFSAQKMDQWG